MDILDIQKIKDELDNSITIIVKYPDGREADLVVPMRHLRYIHETIQEIVNKTDAAMINKYWYYPNPISESYKNK